MAEAQKPFKKHRHSERVASLHKGIAATEILLSDIIIRKLTKKLADCRDLTPAACAFRLVHSKAISFFP
jgi:hypothetical protein